MDYQINIIIYFYLGCRDKKIGQILKDVIQTDYFRVSVVDDVEAVEACGALKVFNLSLLN
jgi:glycerol-3-phosphate dehydrogenase